MLRDVYAVSDKSRHKEQSRDNIPEPVREAIYHRVMLLLKSRNLHWLEVGHKARTSLGCAILCLSTFTYCNRIALCHCGLIFPCSGIIIYQIDVGNLERSLLKRHK